MVGLSIPFMIIETWVIPEESKFFEGVGHWTCITWQTYVTKIFIFVPLTFSEIQENKEYICS